MEQIIDFETFKKKLIERSNEITTSFFIDESTDEQFEEYYDEFKNEEAMDVIIWKAAKKAYDDQ